jgi:hypothetical protein
LVQYRYSKERKNEMTTATKMTEAGDPIAAAGRKALQDRVERGLDLFAMRGHEIQDLGGGVYAVPAQFGTGVYRVEYAETEHCGCDDHKFNPHLSCKHLVALGIYHAKMRKRRRNFIASFVAEAKLR